MRFLVFQHIAVEHPGIFRDFMGERGIGWDAVELDEGEPIPPLDGYDALLVMGGPMDVWDEPTLPWLAAEKAAIRAWVGGGRPMLGLCLGHQLLADALGGRVERMSAPEVGLCTVDLRPEAAADRLLGGLPSPLACLQWHGSGVTALPTGATLLASSAACPVQAFRVGEVAWGLQFHVEVTTRTVPEWGCVPEYAASLRATMGEGAEARLQDEALARMPDLAATARRVFDNFLAIL